MITAIILPACPFSYNLCPWNYEGYIDIAQPDSFFSFDDIQKKFDDYDQNVALEYDYQEFESIFD